MNLNFIISLFLLLVFSSVSYAVPISDPANPHNMSSLATHSGPKAKKTVDGGTEQICVFCHTPHAAAPQTPLWNRPDPEGPNGDGSFPIYAAAKIALNPGLTGYDPNSVNYPSGASRMCLSCHDGATSIGVLLANSPIQMEGGINTIINNSAVLNLATSHPISFNYNQAVVNDIDPLNTSYQVPAASFTPLDGSGQMQCTTCHDPHEDTRVSSGENLPFWRHDGTVTVVDSLYDDVCNSCHTDRSAGVTPSPPSTHIP